MIMDTIKKFESQLLTALKRKTYAPKHSLKTTSQIFSDQQQIIFFKATFSNP